MATPESAAYLGLTTVGSSAMRRTSPIGRDAQNDLVLPDNKVSRHHPRLTHLERRANTLFEIAT